MDTTAAGKTALLLPFLWGKHVFSLIRSYLVQSIAYRKRTELYSGNIKQANLANYLAVADVFKTLLTVLQLCDSQVYRDVVLATVPVSYT